jgi:septum formation protein
MAVKKLILASSSPYRKALLQKLGLPFETIAPAVDEAPFPNEPPETLVKRLAIAKARAVAENQTNALIIGADQVAVHAGKMIGKPHTHEKAVQQLRAVSGSAIILYTGLALINSNTGRLQIEVVPFRVVFRQLTDTQIENYLRKEQPYDCAGSVKSEGLGIALLERMEGEDPNTLIGLPLIRLVRMLENEGVTVI